MCVCVCVQVWFRRGVNSHNPCGSGWISIGGEMMVVDVGLNEQVKRSFQPGHNVLVFPFLLFNANSVCITNVSTMWDVIFRRKHLSIRYEKNTPT